MMKRAWKRIITAALALMIAASVWPVDLFVSTAQAAGVYGKVTADGVRVRKQASTSANYWFKLDKDYVVEVLGTTTSGGITWYKVYAEHPNTGTLRWYTGYIHSDFFTPLTAEETTAWLNNSLADGEGGFLVTENDAAGAAPEGDDGDAAGGESTGGESAGGESGGDESAGDESAGGAEEEGKDPEGGDSPSGDSNTSAESGAMGQVTSDKVNFRKTEGGALIEKLNKGTVVELLTIPPVVSSSHWYKVRYDGQVGYIMSTFIRVISVGGSASSGVTSTYGFVKLVKSSANLRLTPGGSVGAQWETTGEVLRVTGSTKKAKGYTWYPVVYNGSPYYVREDTVQFMATAEGGTVGGGSTTTDTVVGYVLTTKPGVNLRLKPAGEMIEQIKKGLVLPMLAAPVSITGSSYTWYYVKTSEGVKGYMRSDCVKQVNADGSDVGTVVPPSSGDSSTSTTNYGYVKTIKPGVNLRSKPAGTSQEQIAEGKILPMTGYSIKSGQYDWYPVKAESGRTGYLRGDCVITCDANGNAAAGVTPPADDSTSSGGSTDSTIATVGYVKITESSVNLRKTPGGSKVGTLQKDTVWPMWGEVKTNDAGGYDWYPVNMNGTLGYVRGDCCYQLSKSQEESYLAGNGVPKEDQAVETKVYYVMTNDSVRLRYGASKDAAIKTTVEKGTVMAFNTTSTVGGTKWYRVIYGNEEVWVMGTYVDEMTQAQYDQWAAANPEDIPATEVIAGYVKTTESGVNVRSTPGGSKILGRVDKNLVLTYGEKTEKVKGYYWYYCKTVYGYGYLRSDCVEECDASGNAIETPSTGAPGSGQEASYTTLRYGSKGTSVKNMVTELKNQGFYTGDITSEFNSAVLAAVKKFQTAKGLTVDGIAGPDTLHTLYGTVPVGSGNASNLTFSFYPVEKIDWFTGGIQSLWAKGSSYKVYDVKTGIVWWARRWSGAYHADVEPLTAADTARLCKIYGVDDAQDIWDENMWHRRPCLVTIGTRTFACSLYGMPHNEDGDTIKDNNMTGQICIHFTNSKIHGDDGNSYVCRYHQEAIQEAYDWGKTNIK